MTKKCIHGRQCFSRCSECLGHPINFGKCSRCKKKYTPQISDRIFNGKYLQTCPNCRLQMCPHQKLKSKCKECLKKQKNYKCIHKKRKSRCKIKGCGTKSEICIHEKQKDTCKICSPNSNAFCKNCRLFRVTIRSNHLCSYCNPNRKSKGKTKELKLKQWIDEKFPQYPMIHNKMSKQSDVCERYFPDFVFDRGYFMIVLECDEYAHQQYPRNCEIVRMNNIQDDFGLPTVFIRWNPDLKNVSMNEKLKCLKETLEIYFKKTTSNPEVVYLFYSKKNDQNVY